MDILEPARGRRCRRHLSLAYSSRRRPVLCIRGLSSSCGSGLLVLVSVTARFLDVMFHVAAKLEIELSS